MKFIISISLLILCIIISQSVDYYLQRDLVEGLFFDRLFGKKKKNNPPPTTTSPPPKTPLFIEKYAYDIETNKYLEKVQINDMYTSVKYALNVPTIKTKQNMVDYLNLLERQLNGIYTPPIPNLIYFCISLPSAFHSFYLPDDTIPIPYNKLHSEMKDIFPHSAAYKQIQTLCVLWNLSMILLTPSGPIMDPKSEIFINIIGGYISQIKYGVKELKKIYTLSSL